MQHLPVNDGVTYAVVIWNKASILGVDGDSREVPAQDEPYCIAIDITGFTGDVVLWGLPKEAWEIASFLPFYQVLRDLDFEMYETSVGFSRGRNLEGAPKTLFFSGEEVFTYDVGKLNFWMHTKADKYLLRTAEKEEDVSAGLFVFFRIEGDAGLYVTNPFTNYGALFSEAWEGYLEGDISFEIKLYLFGENFFWRWGATGAIVASLDGDTGTKPPQRDLCGKVQNPKGIFATVVVGADQPGFGGSWTEAIANFILFWDIAGDEFYQLPSTGEKIRGKPYYFYMLYRSERQADGTYEESIDGLGLKFIYMENVCLMPGLCFRVEGDLAVADSRSLGRCDVFKDLYESFPDGPAVSIRGVAVPTQLFGLIRLGAEGRAEARIVLSASRLAIMSQVKVLLTMWGVAVEANLAVGTYPQIYYRANAQLRMFNIFTAEIDILGKLPKFDLRTVLDWKSMSLVIRGRFVGDIMEAIAEAVSRLLNYFADQARRRFNEAIAALDAMYKKLLGLFGLVDILNDALEGARNAVKSAKAVGYPGSAGRLCDRGGGGLPSGSIASSSPHHLAHGHILFSSNPLPILLPLFSPS